MSRVTEVDVAQIKAFILERIAAHPRFRTGLDRADRVPVSLERYPSDLFVTLWLGQEPDAEMRRYAYDLEAELASMGVSCSIILKADRELPFGGRLSTSKGEFSYRYYELDPVRDEEMVFTFAVYQGAHTYRFRLSLSGTLASMLRGRNRLSEDRIVEVYLHTMRTEIERGDVEPETTREIMFDSRDLKLFTSE